jgi:hypothetical protein
MFTTEKLEKYRKLGIPIDDGLILLAQIGDRRKAEKEAKKAAENAKNVATTGKEIISVKWVDKDNKEKERKQTLSGEWVSIKILTNGFQDGDKIKIKIEEIDGKLEKELTATKRKDDILIIKNAFQFDKKNANNVNRVVKVTASYEDKSVEGEYVLKENSGGIWGTKKGDATKVMNDIKTVFSDKKFAEFNALIQTDTQDNKHIAYIDQSNLYSILQNLSNEEDKLAVELMANTINSNKVHEVYFGKSTDEITEESKAEEIIQQDPNLILIKKSSTDAGKTPKLGVIGVYGGVTIPTASGSFSLIIVDGILPTDYYHSRLKDYVKYEPSLPKIMRSIITLHEIVGHGRPLSLGITDADEAIYFENLLLRITSNGFFQRDGTNHSDFHKIDNPKKLPTFR